MSATGTHEIVTPIVVAPRRAPDTRVAAGATTAGPPPASRWRRIRLDLIAYALYALLAAWVTIRVWPGADHRVSTIDANDQAFFEWMLSHGARVVTHFDSPWFTDRMNVPTGVNLMANTSILALSIPMTPITLWLGPEVSYGVLIALGLTGTAAAWYFVMSRRLVTSRWAAGIGGAVAGFGPGIVSHANGHPNIVAQFLVPFIVWRVIRLREPGRAVRNGVILGLLVTVQVFVNEEILFMTGLGLALFIAAYAWKQRDEVRAATAAFLRGLGVAVAVAGVLLAYPLFLQFFGPASYHGLQPAIQSYGTDVASLPAFASRTVLGPFADNGHLAPNPVEENGFLGWPVLIAVAMSMYWLRRNSIAVAAGAAALGLTLLALGPKIYFNTSRTSIPGPWALVRHLPLFDSVVPTRLSLMVLPIVAVLIALAHDRVLTLYRRSPAHAGPGRRRAPRAARRGRREDLLGRLPARRRHLARGGDLAVRQGHRPGRVGAGQGPPAGDRARRHGAVPVGRPPVAGAQPGPDRPDADDLARQHQPWPDQGLGSGRARQVLPDRHPQLRPRHRHRRLPGRR
jgi:hypothetical protein